MADTSLWLDGQFGQRSCSDLTSADIQNIDSRLGAKTCEPNSPMNKNPSLSANEIAESQFFNIQASQQLEGTICEISNIERFANDSDLIDLRAEDIANKVPLIKEQLGLATKAFFDLQQMIVKNNDLAALCRNSSPDKKERCLSELESARKAERLMETSWQQHRALAQATLEGLWQGHTETMAKFIDSLIRADKAPNPEQMASLLRQQIPLVKTELIENKNQLLDQSAVSGGQRNFNKLSDTTKRQLIEGSLHSGAMSQAIKDKDEAMVKLLCRLEGRYTKGRDTLDRTLGASTLALGGFAGMLAKIPIAIRAGRAGSLLVRARASSSMVGALAIALDTATISESIYRECTDSSMNYRVNSCPTSGVEYKQSEVSHLKQNNCILNAALKAAPAGLLASSSAIKALAPKLGAQKLQKAELAAETNRRQLLAETESTQARLSSKGSVAQHKENQVHSESTWAKKVWSELGAKKGSDQLLYDEIATEVGAKTAIKDKVTATLNLKDLNLKDIESQLNKNGFKASRRETFDSQVQQITEVFIERFPDNELGRIMKASHEKLGIEFSVQTGLGEGVEARYMPMYNQVILSPEALESAAAGNRFALLHEIHHASLNNKLNAGIKTPYQIDIVALSPEANTPFASTLPAYGQFFSFEELSTFSKSVRQGNTDIGRDTIMMAFGESKNLVNKALREVETAPAKINFTQSTPSTGKNVMAQITIPSLSGKPRSQMNVFLVEAKSDMTADQKLTVLKKYLKEVGDHLTTEGRRFSKDFPTGGP